MVGCSRNPEKKNYKSNINYKALQIYMKYASKKLAVLL